jgi:hypothetical protein
MADNVKEWCLNGYNKGFVTAGGSWNDPAYRLRELRLGPRILDFRHARFPVRAPREG